jgi:hypothetical protein
MKMEEEKLETQMEFAKYEHETAMLRERKCTFLLFLFAANLPEVCSGIYRQDINN